jgi:hypothetical protein
MSKVIELQIGVTLDSNAGGTVLGLIEQAVERGMVRRWQNSRLSRPHVTTVRL